MPQRACKSARVTVRNGNSGFACRKTIEIVRASKIVRGVYGESDPPKSGNLGMPSTDAGREGRGWAEPQTQAASCKRALSLEL